MDNKFNAVLERKNNLFLKSRVFYEKINKNDLLRIKKTMKIIEFTKYKNDVFYSPDISETIIINNNEELLNLYLSRNNNNLVPVKFKNIFEENWGKIVNNGIFFSLLGNIEKKKILLNDNYYNFDLESSGPSILVESCIQIGLECPILYYFINNKKKVKEYIFSYFDFSDEKKYKEIIYSIFYIENDFSSLYNELNLDVNKDFPKFLIDLKKEIDMIREKLIEYNPELWNYCKNNFHKIKYKKYRNSINDFGRNNIKGFFLALYLQEQEKRIISGIIEWLYNNSNILKSSGKNGVFIYEYDGFYLLKENVNNNFGNYNKFVSFLNKKTKEIFGINLKWNCKINENSKLDNKIDYIDNFDENIIFTGILLIIVILLYLSKKIIPIYRNII